MHFFVALPIESSPPTEFEVQRPIASLVEQRLTQGDVLGAIDGGLVGLFKNGGAKPVEGTLLAFIDVLTGKREDLDDLWNLQGAILNGIAVVREGANPFTLAIIVDDQWLAVGTIKDLQSAVPHMVSTGSSPKEIAVHAQRTARRAEYDAAKQAEKIEKQKLRESNELLAKEQQKKERAQLAKRSGLIG
jgi:hypothetical protein